MKIWMFILYLFCTGVAYGQQNAMYTQYMFNSLAINPAYSSVDEAINITTLARKQWTGFEGAPSTQTLSFHSPIKYGSKTSVGVIVVKDAIGEVLSEQGVFGTIAHKVKIADRVNISAGINIGFTRFKADYSEINENINPDFTFTDQKDKNFNIGFGFMLFTDIFYAGFSSPFFSYRNINNNYINENNYVPHFIVQSGIVLEAAEDIKVKPSVLFKYVNGAPLQADINTNFYVGKIFGFGASWRSMDSFDFLMSAQISHVIQFGYSYDFTTSNLLKYQKGSHEVMLKLRFSKDQSANRCYF